MKKAASILLVLLACGCASQPKYVEGTLMQVGAYIPVEGTIYGAEVVNYLNGCKVTTVSNMPFKVDRIYASTNEYLWGMVKTKEFTHTKVEVKDGD